MNEQDMVISRAELAELATLKSKALIIAVVKSVNFATHGMAHENVRDYFKRALKSNRAEGGMINALVTIPDEEKAEHLLQHFLSVLPSRLSFE